MRRRDFITVIGGGAAAGPLAARADEACQQLITVPGIGPIISSAMVAAIGNGAAFCKGRDFAAWLGLVPKQMSTGDRTILGRISKRGNRYLRMLFIQGARAILLRPASWAKHSFGSWLMAAARRLHRNVLAVANGFAERLIGSIRRECVDHFIVLGEAHLRRILRSYARYYNDIRTHWSLDKDAPVSRSIQRIGIISSRPILGGLHHHYTRI